jgi:hypothetical protein
MTVEGDLISRAEVFDEGDLDAALANFEELHPLTRRLENAASRVVERFLSQYAVRDWNAVAQTLSDGVCTDDRRRVVGAGLRHGRDAAVADMRAIADLGRTDISSTVMATRGDHLALSRMRYSGHDRESGAFLSETLSVVETNADDQVAAQVSFDVDDIDTAFEELDARYLAGEAAAHARTWSAIAETYTTFNRQEIPPTAPDWVNIDHRRLARPAIETDELAAYLHTVRNHMPHLSIRIEAVHRLSNRGAVVTNAAYATSPDGFDAEWRMIELLMAEGDLLTRCELFDEADIDSALARFEDLHSQTRRLENAASRLGDLYLEQLVARDWDAMAEMLADDYHTDDRRLHVGGGIHDRDTEIANARVGADIGITHITPAIIATRGERLALSRVRYSGRDQGQEAFVIEMLTVSEINAQNRIAATIVFDPDDIDAAYEELDARYLAGEATAHAHTWPIIEQVYRTLNRREIPATTPDWVNIDHGRGTTFAPGELVAFVLAAWDLMRDVCNRVETVHRLTNLGAVLTRVSNGTSHTGFDAEWREIDILTVEGDLINRFELFNEADLDAALARFDELNQPSPRLENAATRGWARMAEAFDRRDMDAYLALSTADARYEDRRRGLRDELAGTGRVQAARALFEVAPSNFRMTVEPIAIRGSRLALTRVCFLDVDGADRSVATEVFQVTDVSDEGLIRDSVGFDPDDLVSALDELDRRYLQGEAAAHAHTWSVITQAYAAMNRHEIPATTPDWVNIDHRRGIAFAAGDAVAYLTARNAGTGSVYVETVHRLSNLGTVFTWAGHGTSPEGFESEWRGINVLTVDGDLINHCELFDEADIDLAIARFDELDQGRSD